MSVEPEADCVIHDYLLENKKFSKMVELLNSDMRYLMLSGDCAIVDPPYKLTSGGSKGIMKDGIFDPSVYNNSGNLFIETINYSEWIPIVLQWLPINSEMLVFTNDKNMSYCLNAAYANGLKLHNILTWDRKNKTPNRWFMKSVEFICYFYRGRARKINNLGSSAHIDWIPVKKGNRLSPSEKPVDLYKYLITNISNEGEIIIDPFMGSGNCGVAALQTNRRFIGIEKDKRQFLIANENIEGKKE